MPNGGVTKEKQVVISRVITSIKIALLKRKARSLQRFMQYMQDNVSCGQAMLRYISRDYSDAENELKATLRKLRQLDPNYP